MINVIDAKRDPIRPNEKGLNVGSCGIMESKKFLVDANEIPPSEGQAERDWYEQAAKRQELDAAKSDRQGEEEAQAPLAVKAPRQGKSRNIISRTARSDPGAHIA